MKKGGDEVIDALDISTSGVSDRPDVENAFEALMTSFKSQSQWSGTHHPINVQLKNLHAELQGIARVRHQDWFVERQCESDAKSSDRVHFDLFQTLT